MHQVFSLTELSHDISKSNHIQFFKYHGVEDGEFCGRVLKKINKYMLHEIQNSLIKVINSSFCILKASVFLTFYILMIEETTDIIDLELVTMVIY